MIPEFPPAPEDQCDASIIICTYNRIRTLPLTLKSLSALRGTHSFEVIVVNGPSTDGSDAYLAACEGIRVFSNEEANLSKSRNIGIAAATGRYVAFIDDDAVPEPDWLSTMITHLDGHPDLSAVGGFIRDANGMEFQCKYVFCDDFGRGMPCDDPNYVKFVERDTPLFLSLTGTNVVFRRSDLRKIGGFDETFKYFLDETDVNKRMHDAGMQLGMVPEAEIHHKYAPSHLRRETNVIVNMYPIARSIAYFALRHGKKSFGWPAISERLHDYYTEEFRWKEDTVASGLMSIEEFNIAMDQTLSGVIDGIDCYFDGAADGFRAPSNFAPAAPPVLRQMRDAEEALRLCMFSQDHGQAHPAGIGTWTNLVARGLAERGHEVSVIGQLSEGAWQEYVDYTPNGFWSHNINASDNRKLDEAPCLGLPPGLATVSRRRKAEFDRVNPRRQFQVASTPIWDVEAAALVAAGTVPTVLSLHTCAGLMLDSKPEWRENKDYYHNHVLKVINAEIAALKRADLVLANSRTIAEDISNLYGLDLFARPLEIVPHGIADIDKPEGLLNLSDEANRDVRILYLGRLEKRKGVAELVAAMEPLLRVRPNLHLDIVGGKVDDLHLSMVERLVAAYPKNVTYHGFLDAAEIDRLMRQSDIFFAPSLYESFGLIYVEAMRYALPSVGFATGGVSEVVADGQSGLLAPLRDIGALRSALETLIDTPSRRIELSQGARTSFEKNFDYRLMAERLEKIYRETARSRA